MSGAGFARQIDMFAGGGARSVAPHLDPLLVGAVSVRPDIDTDHVGSEEVGKLGNNARVFVVEVLARTTGEILFAQQCPDKTGATRLANEINRKLDGNRQTFFL